MPRLPLVLMLVVASCHLCACAAGGGSAAPPCPPPAQGGPAPATVLSADQHKALKAVLARYKADRMDLAQTRALRDALCGAGLPLGPALDKALAEQGFSLKALAADANPPAGTPPTETKAPVTPSGRVVPPRQ